MKKKFFAVALATTMIASSSLSAIAETKDSLTTQNLKENTGIEKISGDFDVTYTLHQVAGPFANSFMVELRDANNNCIDARSDNWGWTWTPDGGLVDFTNEQKAITLFPQGEDGWGYIASERAKGVDAVANIKRTGDVFYFEFTEKNADGPIVIWTYTIEFPVMDNDTTITLSAGGDTQDTIMTNIKFINNKETINGPAQPTADTTKPNDTTKPSTGEDETTDKVDSPDTNNPDVEPTTPSNPSEDSSNPSVEPTTPSNPSEDSSNPSVEQPTTSDSVTSDFDVTDADAEKVNKEAVVTGLPENVTLRVASIEKSSTDYNAIAEFVNKELKGKKVAAADLSLVKNGVAYAEQPNGKVKVTLPLFENIKDAKWIQVYRYDNAAKKFVEVDKVVEVKDGKFTFETDHFTPYLFASVNGPEEEPTTTAQPTTTGKTVTDTSNKPKTGDSAPIAVFAGMAAAGLAVFAVSKKRKNA